MATKLSRSIAVLLCLLSLSGPAAAQDTPPQPPADRNFLQTLGADLKSVLSTGSLSVLSAATVLALFAAIQRHAGLEGAVPAFGVAVLLVSGSIR